MACHGSIPWGPRRLLLRATQFRLPRFKISGAPANWWIAGSSQGYVAINASDHRPASPGNSVVELTLRASQPTQIDSYLYSMSAAYGKFLLVNGQWQLSFWARATAGSPTLSVRFGRIGQPAFLQQTVTLTTRWTQTVIPFTASDAGVAQTLDLSFIASGPAGLSGAA